MSGSDRELVLYIHSPDDDYWTEFLQEKEYTSWRSALRDNGFPDGDYRIEDISAYDGFRDVDVAVTWAMSDGRRMAGEGRNRVIEALEHLSPEKQDLDGPDDEEERDPYTTRKKGIRTVP